MKWNHLMILLILLATSSIEAQAQASLWTDPDANVSLTLESFGSFLAVDKEQFEATATVISGRYQLPSGNFILADLPVISTRRGILFLKPPLSSWEAGDREFNIGNLTIGMQYEASESVAIILTAVLPTSTDDTEFGINPGLTTDISRLNFTRKNASGLAALTHFNIELSPQFSIVTRTGLIASHISAEHRHVDLVVDLEPALRFKLNSFSLMAGTSVMARAIGKEVSFPQRFLHSYNLALQVDNGTLTGAASLELPTTDNLMPLDAVLAFSFGIRFN